MAAVVVTADNIRFTDAEATTHFGDIGGGPGGGLETDFFYQNANCYARKGTTSPRGFFNENFSSISAASVANPTVITTSGNHELNTGETVLIANESTATPALNGTHVVTVTGATTFTIAVNVTVAGTDGDVIRQHDLTAAGQETVMFKVICTTPGLLEAKASDGFQLAIGSGQSDYYLFDVHGNDTYPIASSWLIIPIDPNISAYRDETVGTPVLTTGNYFGMEYDQTGTSKSPNQGIDAIDSGAGLTLVGGDGGDADGTFADFLAFDEGTVNNRFGYVSSFQGVTFIFGRMVIGTATATEFTDTFQTIVFPDGLFAEGFSGITCDLQNASTDISFFTMQFLGKGSSTTEETRPQLLVTGTSGLFAANSCVFDAFHTVTLTSACSLQDAVFIGCSTIDAAGANLSRSIMAAPTIAANESAIIWDVNSDPDGELDDIFIIRDPTNLSHAVEFGLNSPLTMTIRGMNAVAYSSSNNVNNSTFHVKRTTGTVTINVISGTGNFSYRSDGATVVIVTDTQTVAINVKNELKANLQNVRVFLETNETQASGEIFEAAVTSITQAAGVATVTMSAVHNLETGDLVVIRGAQPDGYNKVATATVTSTTVFTYPVDSGLSSPATATPIVSYVAIHALTDSSGNVSVTRSFGVDQDFIGWARLKNASSPFYQDADLSFKVDSTNGNNVNAVLLDDE